MANTVNRNYPLTGINDAPDGPLAIQRLAEAVDLDVKGVNDELDVLAAGAVATITPHVDYANISEALTVSRFGKMVVLSGRVARKLGKTTTVIGNVPAGFLPAQVAHSSIISRVGTTGSAGPTFHLYVNPPDGALGLTLINAATWNDTHWIPLNVTWMTA